MSLSSDNGDNYCDVCISAESWKFRRDGVGSEHLCLLQMGILELLPRKTGIQGKRNPGTKGKFSNKRNYFSSQIDFPKLKFSLSSFKLKSWLKVKFTVL